MFSCQCRIYSYIMYAYLLGSYYGICRANKDGNYLPTCTLNLEFSDEKQKIIKIVTLAIHMHYYMQ